MVAVNSRTVLAFLAAGVALAATTVTASARACPFCGGADGKTLTADAGDASLILFGKLSNAGTIWSSA